MVTAPDRAPLSDPNRVNTLITGFYSSAVVFAAAELGVFAELSHQRKATAAMLAHTLQLNTRSTTLLLDACVSLGILQKECMLYRNSPDAETYLVPGRPMDFSSMIRSCRELYPVWMSLPEFARAGMPVKAGPGPANDPDSLSARLLAQHARTLAIGRPIIRRLDLENKTKLLEVGGAPGTYSMLISLERPTLQCTVLHEPEVCKVVRGLIAQHGAARVSTLEGDYLTTALPKGNDVVLMFGALHGERAEHIPRLIRRAAEALNPGGLLYVMDIMTDETRTLPSTSALFALNIALTGREGQIFSHVELQQWMEQAGLQDYSVEVLPPPVSQWLARGRKRL